MLTLPSVDISPPLPGDTSISSLRSLPNPHPHFNVIKEHYPHSHHLTSRNNEFVYYDFSPRTNIAALKQGGMTLDELLRHYVLVCEYMWIILAPAKMAQLIYIMDLNGIKVRNFAGEVIKFMRRDSAFTRDHYPEQLGTMFVLNVSPEEKEFFDLIRRNNAAVAATLENGSGGDLCIQWDTVE